VRIAPAGERIEAYDLARAFAIAFVFLGNIIIGQTTSSPLKVALGTLSPGLTMSLLGFISAALLSSRTGGAGELLLKRFTRIYIPLFTCLTVVLVIQTILGTTKVNLDTAFHYLGLTGFFELLPSRNDASVGGGLWFVTTILSMYLLLPALQRVFAHRRGLIHLLVVIALSLVAHRLMYAAGAWNVVIAFCIGTYLGVNGRLEAPPPKEDRAHPDPRLRRPGSLRTVIGQGNPLLDPRPAASLLPPGLHAPLFRSREGAAALDQ
jgi:hypothetical protein